MKTIIAVVVTVREATRTRLVRLVRPVGEGYRRMSGDGWRSKLSWKFNRNNGKDKRADEMNSIDSSEGNRTVLT